MSSDTKPQRDFRQCVQSMTVDGLRVFVEANPGMEFKCVAPRQCVAAAYMRGLGFVETACDGTEVMEHERSPEAAREPLPQPVERFVSNFDGLPRKYSLASNWTGTALLAKWDELATTGTKP